MCLLGQHRGQKLWSPWSLSTKNEWLMLLQIQAIFLYWYPNWLSCSAHLNNKIWFHIPNIDIPCMHRSETTTHANPSVAERLHELNEEYQKNNNNDAKGTETTANDRNGHPVVELKRSFLSLNIYFYKDLLKLSLCLKTGDILRSGEWSLRNKAVNEYRQIKLWDLCTMFFVVHSTICVISEDIWTVGLYA